MISVKTSQQKLIQVDLKTSIQRNDPHTNIQKSRNLGQDRLLSKNDLLLRLSNVFYQKHGLFYKMESINI